MTLRYAVGIRIGNKTDQMTVEAEDALIAALKVKTANPEAAITYVRKRNARGDRRHPHSSQVDENPAKRIPGHTAPVHGTIAEAMPDPVPKPPGRPPGEPIIIKDPPRPPEVPEIDGSLDEEDDPEIKNPPDIVPEKPPPPAPWDRADRPSDVMPPALRCARPPTVALSPAAARAWRSPPFLRGADLAVGRLSKRRDRVRRQQHPDALPAPRRSQAHRSARRQPNRADLETAAGQHTSQGTRASMALAAGAR